MSKAVDAQQLLDNPLFIQAFDNTRENIVAQIEAGSFEDIPLMNQLTVSLQLLSSVKRQIQDEVNTGMLDEAELS